VSFPYLDLAGYQIRTIIQAQDVQWLEAHVPGWIAQRIASWSSWINAQARKRYGTGATSSLPFGQSAPSLVGSGTSPPGVTLTGRPTLGSLQVTLQVTTPGALGVAVFQWSKDGGKTWTTGVLTAATVVLGATGMTAAFSAGAYGIDNVYAAATPVAEVILGWLVSLVNLDVMRKRGTNPQDPALEMMVDETKRVFVEVQQAADGKDGLWELPTSEDQDSAVTVTGPLAYTEASPFVAADMQEIQGVVEDDNRSGTYGGN
jgi:hypothetical protein